MFTTHIDPDRYLYHYTRYEKAFEHILPSLRLKMGIFDYVNDPRESKTWFFTLICPTESPSNNEFFKLQEDASRIVKGTCKVLCLTRDNPIVSRDRPHDVFGRGYAHPRMWAQYAGNHTGVCLILDREKLINRISQDLGHKGTIYHGPVVYDDRASIQDIRAFELNYDGMRQLSLERFIESHLETYHHPLFFRKALDWSHEWEYRFILRGSDTSDEYVSIEDSLAAICLGDGFAKDYEPLVIETCKKLNIYGVRIWWRNGFPVILPEPYGSLSE